MLIIVDLSAFYDWEPTDRIPTDAEVSALRAKPGHNGKWLERVVKQTPTHTTISLHESEIENCVAHFERVGAPKTREKVVAWYLEEKVMPHHAHPDHWTNISVHEEPGVEKFLRRYFNLQQGDAHAP